MSIRTRQRPKQTRYCVLLAAVLAVLAGCGSFCHHLDDGLAHAEPARKAARHSKIVPTNRAAPDITATIPKKAATPKAAPVLASPHEDETLPPPFNLPSAPRSKMRACGEQWESIKMSGRAASRTWRNFATNCLAGTSEAARTIP